MTEAYNKIKNAPSLIVGLMEHFAYLADTKGFDPVLFQVMTLATNVQLNEQDSTLIVRFSNGEVMTCFPPAAENEYVDYPKSFRQLMSVHSSISFPDDGGWALELGESGNFESNIAYGGFVAVQCPLTDYSDWWIYHHNEKNEQGEPILCLFSHESSEIETAVSCNVGSLFLKRVAEYFDINAAIPDVDYDFFGNKEDVEETNDSLSTEEEEEDDALTDDDIYEMLSKFEKAVDVANFISQLENIHSSGLKLSKDGADYLVLYTNNMIVGCLNNELDPFPVFETFIRLFPNARRKRFHDQLSYNVGDFILAIAQHKEYYPQIKAAYMDGVIDEDNVSALYYIAIRLAHIGLIEEALVELKRMEEAGVPLYYISIDPDDFPQEIRDEIEALQTKLNNKKQTS